MNFIKTIILSSILLLSLSLSAEIKFRTTAPTFSNQKTKHNQRINNISNKQNTHQNNISYLSIDNDLPSTYRQTITGNNTNYYKKYNNSTTNNPQVSHNNYPTIKSYNVANRTPFDGEETAINTTSAQYSQFGPPDKGPIGDVIWPLLIFVGIYILKLKVES